MFESAVSKVFFETFAVNLHGKKVGYSAPKGLNVLVNTAQRMLAVQQPGEKNTLKTPHLLIKIATDGQFTMTHATPQAANPAPAVTPVVVAPAPATAHVGTQQTANPAPAMNPVVPAPVPAAAHVIPQAATPTPVTAIPVVPTPAPVIPYNANAKIVGKPQLQNQVDPNSDERLSAACA